MSTRARAAIVVLAGIAVAAVLAIASGASAGDTAVVLMLAAAGSLAAAAAGAVLLRTLRGRSLRTQVLAVAIATTVTMVVGVLVAAAFMLVSNHDVAVLAVVLVVAGSVAGERPCTSATRMSTTRGESPRSPDGWATSGGPARIRPRRS